MNDALNENFSLNFHVHYTSNNIDGKLRRVSHWYGTEWVRVTRLGAGRCGFRCVGRVTGCVLGVHLAFCSVGIGCEAARACR